LRIVSSAFLGRNRRHVAARRDPRRLISAKDLLKELARIFRALLLSLQHLRGATMSKLGTHYEQVPVNAVLRMANLDNHDLPYPQWQDPLVQAQLETDPQKVQEKVFQAEAAIFARLQELAAAGDGYEESQAISKGTAELLKIKTDKLKWPLP
jgi:hypothetical protein